MCIYVRMRFPGGTVVKNLPANAGDAGVLVSISGLGRSPGRASSRIFLPGESQGQRSWRDTVHRIIKSQTRLSTAHGGPALPHRDVSDGSV